MAIIGTEFVKAKIKDVFDRREAAFYALCLFYAAKALNLFNERQASAYYWENRTYQAKDRVFSDAINGKDFFGFFLAHGVQYGVYLEFANDGQNAALWPIVRELVNPFLKDLKKLYGVNVI